MFGGISSHSQQRLTVSAALIIFIPNNIHGNFDTIAALVKGYQIYPIKRKKTAFWLMLKGRNSVIVTRDHIKYT